MNKISNDVINQKLKEDNLQLRHKYGENRIFGTFVVGLANYGYAETTDEIKTITVYLPSFEELCISKPRAKEDVVDIRMFYRPENIMKYNYLELLFSDYCIINPKYSNIYAEHFLKNRNIIAKFSIKDKIDSLYERAVAAMEKDKNIFELYRLYIAVQIYVSGGDVNNCYHFKANEITEIMLWDAKNNPERFSQEMIDKMLYTLKHLYEQASDDKSYNAQKVLKNGIIKMISASLESSVSIDSFLSSLTEKEMEAWKSLENLFKEGTTIISISKISAETNISRPIWKNLLQKLESNKIATIQNLGVKGTKITMNT